jgi:helix-turn-helix protein
VKEKRNDKYTSQEENTKKWEKKLFSGTHEKWVIAARNKQKKLLKSRENFEKRKRKKNPKRKKNFPLRNIYLHIDRERKRKELN